MGICGDCDTVEGFLLPLVPAGEAKGEPALEPGLEPALLNLSRDPKLNTCS